MEILLVTGGIVCGFLWYMYRENRNLRKQEAEKWRKEALLAELEGVVQDFLGHGKAVAQITGGAYRGVLSLRFHTDPKTGEGFFSVSMYDSGDLGGFDRTVLEEYCLTGFVEKYGYYYDPERNAVVYETGGGIYFQSGEERQFQQRLLHRIQKHPLAVLKSGNGICTRGI